MKTSANNKTNQNPSVSKLEIKNNSVKSTNSDSLS